eukprot:scaffold3504_cov240-Pinguiococcus_pyrenoidosus.AAC.30
MGILSHEVLKDLNGSAKLTGVQRSDRQVVGRRNDEVVVKADPLDPGNHASSSPPGHRRRHRARAAAKRSPKAVQAYVCRLPLPLDVHRVSVADLRLDILPFAEEQAPACQANQGVRVRVQACALPVSPLHLCLQGLQRLRSWRHCANLDEDVADPAQHRRTSLNATPQHRGALRGAMNRCVLGNVHQLCL